MERKEGKRSAVGHPSSWHWINTHKVQQAPVGTLQGATHYKMHTFSLLLQFETQSDFLPAKLYFIQKFSKMKNITVFYLFVVCFCFVFSTRFS